MAKNAMKEQVFSCFGADSSTKTHAEKYNNASCRKVEMQSRVNYSGLQNLLD